MIVCFTSTSIIHAAAISYGFVFMHPFEDGNGRIHRFLKEIVDIPDRLIDLFIQFCLQNNGRLSAKKENRFSGS